jgi:PRC-barrel domain protein
MLRSLKSLEKYRIGASDGHIGHIKDFYFDDDAWAVRYIVVDTGNWLAGRDVLISPISVDHTSWSEQTLPVHITREQVRNSPGIDTDKPVSRQNEEKLFGFYGYPYYWGGAGTWGDGLYPYALSPGYISPREGRVEHERKLEGYLRDERARHRNDNPNLRSCNAVAGYRVHANDGELGHVTDFLVDADTWAIRQVVIDTSNWWLGHKVLVAPWWITGVQWSERLVAVDLARDRIRNSPYYDPAVEWSETQDQHLHQHYGASVNK